MIGNDAVREHRFAFGRNVRRLDRGLNQRFEQINIIIIMAALKNGGNTL